MISVIIAVKSKLLSFINILKNNFQSIAVIIIMILTAFLFIKNEELKTTRHTLDKAIGNYEFYMNKCSGIEE